MPVVPALGRQRQVDLWEFEAILVYKSKSRTGSKAIQRNPVLKIKTKFIAGWWWHIPLILALRRQRQADLCEFKGQPGL